MYGSSSPYSNNGYDNLPGRPYEPYPSVSPSIRPLDDYGFGHRSHNYGDDD